MSKKGKMMEPLANDQPHVYTLRVVGGEVVIDDQTAKEAAIDDIRAQPFYAPNLERTK